MFPGATEAHALPFATTNYEADEAGTLHAVLPSRCVYATGEQTCAMFVDHYRKRKTGPCYAVAVVGRRVATRPRTAPLSVPGGQLGSTSQLTAMSTFARKCLVAHAAQWLGDEYGCAACRGAVKGLDRSRSVAIAPRTSTA